MARFGKMMRLDGRFNGQQIARGVRGQLIKVDPTAEMVIARCASFPLAANGNIDPTSLPANHALAKHLIANPRCS